MWKDIFVGVKHENLVSSEIGLPPRKNMEKLQS